MRPLPYHTRPEPPLYIPPRRVSWDMSVTATWIIVLFGCGVVWAWIWHLVSGWV